MAELSKTIFNNLKKSKYTVVLSGFGMLAENGYPAIRDGEESYDIELKYGYSAEELLSSAFFSTRKEQFYDFYRNEILSALDILPGKGYCNMAKLEKEGLFQAIITRRIFGLPTRAGCKNMIELHGSVYRNYCVHCGKSYPMEYIRNSKKIPLCEQCEQVVRPDICLFGEMVDNQVMTRAANEVQKADVLVVLGTHLKTYLCDQLVKYYEGNKLILITEEQHFSNEWADIYWESRVDEALDKIIMEMEKDNE